MRSGQLDVDRVASQQHPENQKDPRRAKRKQQRFSMPCTRGLCLAEQRRLVVRQPHQRLAAQQVALLELPVIDDVVRSPYARPGVERAQYPEQGEERRHDQGEHFAPPLIEVAHGRDERDDQERLRRQVGIRAIGQDAGFVLDLATVEVKTLLGRAEHPGVVLADLVFRGRWGNYSRHSLLRKVGSELRDEPGAESGRTGDGTENSMQLTTHLRFPCSAPEARKRGEPQPFRVAVSAFVLTMITGRFLRRRVM